MTLKEIFNQMQEFVENNPEVYDINDEGEDMEIIEEFDDLQDRIFNDNQTYFTFDVDGDCYETDEAFRTVLSHSKDKTITDYYVDYIYDDKLMILVEYK